MNAWSEVYSELLLILHANIFCRVLFSIFFKFFLFGINDK